MYAPTPPAPPNYANTSHTAHLIVTIITCGLWAPFWILHQVLNGMGNSAKRKAYELQYRNYQQYMARLQQHHNYYLQTVQHRQP